MQYYYLGPWQGEEQQEQEQDFLVLPALATAELHLALTQLHIAIPSWTQNTTSWLGVIVKPVSLPPKPPIQCIVEGNY